MEGKYTTVWRKVTLWLIETKKEAMKAGMEAVLLWGTLWPVLFMVGSHISPKFLTYANIWSYEIFVIGFASAIALAVIQILPALLHVVNMVAAKASPYGNVDQSTDELNTVVDSDKVEQGNAKKLTKMVCLVISFSVMAWLALLTLTVTNGYNELENSVKQINYLKSEIRSLKEKVAQH